MDPFDSHLNPYEVRYSCLQATQPGQRIASIGETCAARAAVATTVARARERSAGQQREATQSCSGAIFRNC